VNVLMGTRMNSPIAVGVDIMLTEPGAEYVASRRMSVTALRLH